MLQSFRLFSISDRMTVGRCDKKRWWSYGWRKKNYRWNWIKCVMILSLEIFFRSWKKENRDSGDVQLIAIVCLKCKKIVFFLLLINTGKSTRFKWFLLMTPNRCLIIVFSVLLCKVNLHRRSYKHYYSINSQKQHKKKKKKKKSTF